MKVQTQQWLTTIGKAVINATVAGLFALAGFVFAFNERVHDVEVAWEHHRTAHSHSNYFNGDRILHSGLHLAVEGEIERHAQTEIDRLRDELKRVVTRNDLSRLWHHFFDLNPEVKEPNGPSWIRENGDGD